MHLECRTWSLRCIFYESQESNMNLHLKREEKTCAKNFLPDPFPVVSRDADNIWIYGRAEREVFRLQELIREKNEAKLNVGYPGEFMMPHRKMHFRAEFPEGVFPVISCIGVPGITEISMDKSGVFEFTLETENALNDIPCFSCNADVAWESSADGVCWNIASKVFSGKVPPHRIDMAHCKMIPERLPDGMYDVGMEIFGYVYVRNALSARMYVGESVPEAQNRDSEYFEQSNDLIRVSEDTLRSAVPLAFRYIALENADNAELSVDALYTPMVLKKHFSCGDDELDAIWAHSVYTLRLCTRYFLNDGIKRDRLPWAGDLAVSLWSMTESFCEPSPVRDTLAVLGSAGVRNMPINGICDYTPWYLIDFELYIHHFGDFEFLKQEYFKIVETVDLLLEQRLDNGLLPLSGWVFVDWTDGDKNCAVQVLFYMALKAVAKLAAIMQDNSRSEKWNALADELNTIIHRDFYDAKRGLFRCSPEKDEFLRHQNIFAVGSIATPEEARRIGDNLLKKELPPVGTPYMKTFEIMALVNCGFRKEAADEIRRYWGGMLKLGAATFFEAYGEGKIGQGIYDFYGRPFGLSLCHAWSSAPAFLLPMIFKQCS